MTHSARAEGLVNTYAHNKVKSVWYKAKITGHPVRMFGQFYGMSTLVWLFYTEIGLTVFVISFFVLSLRDYLQLS